MTEKKSKKIRARPNPLSKKQADQEGKLERDWHFGPAGDIPATDPNRFLDDSGSR